MEFHPSQLPVSKTFELDNETQASEAVAEMVRLGFAGQKSAFRVLMTNDKNIAKKIGFLIIMRIQLNPVPAMKENMFIFTGARTVLMKF